MTIVPHEDFVLPPLEAFLITPQFVASDLWVWPLFAVAVFFFMRGYHQAAGLTGRAVDLIIALKALNGLFLWSIIIGLSNAVHRATDDVIVSGLWTGVALTLTTGGLQLLFRYSPIAPTYRRVQDAILEHRAKLRQEEKARKEAKARGEVPRDEHGRRVPGFVHPEGPHAAKQHVAVFLRPDLFADPKPEPTPGEPAPQPEKPVDF